MDQAIWPTYFKCALDHGHKGMTMTMRHDPSYTAQPERKLNWSCNGRRNVSQREEGYEKIKLHHFHYHSELPLLETVYPYKFHTL